MPRRNPMASWMSFAFATTKMTLDAQQVIAMRMAKLARGGPAAATEATLMVTEKMQAAMLAANTFGKGQTPASMANVARMYGRKVAANRKRLGKE